MIIRTLSLIMLAAAINACSPTHNTYVTGQPGVEQPVGEQPIGVETDTLGFEIAATVMARNRCMECHSEAKGNRGGINLETYLTTKPLAARILSAMVSGAMPKGGPRVSDADIAIIQAWVDLGAPETSDVPLPAMPIAFSEVNQKIFTPLCIRCHATFNDHAVVSARLNGIINSIDSNRMPLGGPPVPNDLKTLLANWVAQGAKP